MLVLFFLAAILMTVGYININVATVTKQLEQRIVVGDVSLALGTGMAYLSCMLYGEIPSNAKFVLAVGLILIVVGILLWDYRKSKNKNNKKILIGELTLVIGMIFLLISVMGLLE